MKLTRRAAAVFSALLLLCVLLSICLFFCFRFSFLKHAFCAAAHRAAADGGNPAAMRALLGLDGRAFMLSETGTERLFGEGALLWEDALLRVQAKEARTAFSVGRCLCYCEQTGAQTICLQAYAYPPALYKDASARAFFAALAAGLICIGAVFVCVQRAVGAPLSALCARYHAPKAADELYALQSGLALREWEVSAGAEANRAAKQYLLHELRAPLTALSVLAETVSAHPQTARSFAQDAQAQTARMTRLVREFSQSEKGKLSLTKSPLVLDEWLRLALLPWKRIARRAGHALEFKQHGAVSCRVTADADRLSQVICNLLENALKAAPDKEKIRVLLKEEERDGGAFYTVTVVTDGVTVPDALLPRLFERFFSTGTQTGLGLCLCREILCAHDGFMKAENVNSSFRVSFGLPKYPIPKDLLQNRDFTL